VSGAALLGVMLGTCEKANELARICREGSVFEATMINTKPDRVKGDNVLVTIRQSSQNKGLIPRFQAFPDPRLVAESRGNYQGGRVTPPDNPSAPILVCCHPRSLVLLVHPIRSPPLSSSPPPPAPRGGGRPSVPAILSLYRVGSHCCTEQLAA